ncbi:DUF7551 domain-containing protein [Halegenticoccus tardaugens]|uniref:DUF7551 domain-containing protein n=1 Tax=Halegenticoccus tardaugens TaxID=2071624 RepID=UPI00100AA22A|nr:hypothetical protein [Halegenticoccus tardaugens]
MVGTTLVEIRGHIEALASEAGEYYLVCARYGDQPVPAAGLRFEDRATARAAARATEQYRNALRRYDPHLPYCDVIVCQGSTAPAPPTTASTLSAKRRAEPQPRRDIESPTPERDRHGLIDFCHAVAGAAFEAVAASEHDALERAIVDAYLAEAETIDSPDELCLRLLESMATELDRRLTPTEQARLLENAAELLPDPDSNADPLDATLSHVCSVELAREYTLGPCAIDLDQDRRSWDVTLSGYVLDGTTERFTTLPLVIDLLRRRPDPAFVISRARLSTDAEIPSTWSFRLTVTSDANPRGLVCVSEVSTY